MNDFSEEISAYVLQNAVEFGKADASKILPKLFRHGLKKEEIKDVLPKIKEIVKKVNSMTSEQKEKEFLKVKSLIKSRERKENGLAELPNLPKGKKIVTRIAPFPSGALHIGNTKTFLINALYAEKYNGKTILVMDDTIGSAEKPPLKEAYNLIVEALKYLGVKYEKPIVYKSDRLEIYYKYAKKLIDMGMAYVCYCIQDEVRTNRENGKECSCRSFPIKIQKERWKEMFHIKEGHAVLRIKTDMMHPDPAFRDRVLFKISDRKHPRVGKKYRVWPTLEMSWAIDDHELGITHIIRGNELMMETMMEKHIWKIFKWKNPEVLHTGLVKLEGIIGKISKSKSQQEILSGKFMGWDDPRTWSVQSLKRRGIKKEALREFVEDIGLNKQNITIPIESLYAVNRRLIDSVANRYSFVENPIGINIDKAVNEVEVKIHPDKKESRIEKAGEKIFVSDKDFKMLRGKEIRLLHLFNVDLDKNAKVTGNEIKKKMPKINWVSGVDFVKVVILMPNGLWISGIASSAIKELKTNAMIQFERFGFCRFDRKEKDSYEFWFAHK